MKKLAFFFIEKVEKICKCPALQCLDLEQLITDNPWSGVSSVTHPSLLPPPSSLLPPPYSLLPPPSSPLQCDLPSLLLRNIGRVDHFLFFIEFLANFFVNL